MIRGSQEYEHWLHSRVTAAFKNGASTLHEIVRFCRGADPAVVQRMIESNRFEGTLLCDLDSRMDRSRGDAPIHLGLAPPHPLDYEWRFSQEGAESLLSHAKSFATGNLLLLGCTTIGIIASKQGWPGSVHAIDRSPVVAKLIASLGLPVKISLMDLTVPAPAPSIADIVLIDPPWYISHAKAFLNCASLSCRVGGYVLAVLPGTGTRPDADTDCAHLVNWCEKRGLFLERVFPDEIRYETPYFEHNALSAAGIAEDHRGWRRGDLYIFTRRDVPVPPWSPSLKNLNTWEEVRSGQIRVRFKSDSLRNGDTTLRSLVDGDILPSVSKRDIRRDLAQVWTCGNRVFGCKDPHSLYIAMNALVLGNDPAEEIGIALTRPLSHRQRENLYESCSRLIDIVEIEKHEWNQICAREESNVVNKS